MSGIYQWFRPKQFAEKEAAKKSEEVLYEKIHETRQATSRVVKQSRKEVRKSEEVLIVAEQALRTIKGET